MWHWLCWYWKSEPCLLFTVFGEGQAATVFCISLCWRSWQKQKEKDKDSCFWNLIWESAEYSKKKICVYMGKRKYPVIILCYSRHNCELLNVHIYEELFYHYNLSVKYVISWTYCNSPFEAICRRSNYWSNFGLFITAELRGGGSHQWLSNTWSHLLWRDVLAFLGYCI